MAVQYCNYDIKGTLGVVGAATIGGEISFSNNNVGVTMKDAAGTSTRVFRLNSGNTMYIGPIDSYAGGQIFYGAASQVTGHKFHVGGTPQLTIDGSGNATFAENVSLGDGKLLKFGASDDYQIYHNSTTNVNHIFSNLDRQLSINGNIINLTNQANTTNYLKLESTGATFAGDVTVSGGDITLGGTGRIQGVDTVSASTDAANKAYVDAHVSPAGTYLPLAGGTMTTTAKIYFYNTNQYIHANSNNDLTIASADDINYLSNFNRFYTGGVEFARLSGSYDSWIANGTNSKLGINKNSGINYNLDVEGTLRTTSTAIFEDKVGIGMTPVEVLDLKAASGDTRIRLDAASGSDTEVKFFNAGAAQYTIGHDDATDNFVIGGANVDTPLVSVNKAGVLIINGGNISLSGTGRIQGIDTVSASTDAANKAYVDAHVSPAGTYLPLIGGTMSGSIGMGDNDIDGIDELKFSSGTKLGDDGGTSFVSLTYADSGDGGLKVTDNDGHIQGYLYGDGGATSSFGLLDGTGSWAVRCLENEYVELRYDNSTKLNTLTDGVTISGKLGIGTSFPGTEGYSFAEDLVIKGGASASDGAGITIAGNGKRYGIIAFGDAADVNAGEIFYDHNVNAMYFRTNGSNSVVYINSAGKVTAGAATSSGDGSSTLTTKGYVDAQISSIPSGLNFQGNWNASTNSPTLASGTGTPGFYYNVSVAGSTNLDGETDWQVGDWAVFVENGTNDFWEKIDNTSALTGVGANSQLAIWGGTNTLEGTTALTFTGGHLYVTGDGNSSNWYSAYQDTITAFSDSGSSTITLTLTQRDGGTLTTSFSNPQGTTTGSFTSGRIPFANSATNLIDSSNLLWNNGTSQLNVRGAATSLSNQPCIPMLIDNAGSVDGRVMLQIKTTDVSSASAQGAGITLTAPQNTTGTYDPVNSLIFLQSKAPGNQTIHSAPKNIKFYVDNDGTGAGAGTDYNAFGDLAFELFDSGVAKAYYEFQVLGLLNLLNVPNATSDTDKFLVSASGEVKYRTGAQVLSDIGGAPATGGAYLPLAGNTTATAMTGDLYLANQQQARFLTSTDAVGLRIQSSGTSSFIDNENGDMYIRQEADDKDMIFQADDGSGGNATYLKLDGSNRSIVVSAALGVYHNDGIASRFGNSGDLQIYHNATDSVISNATGDLYIENTANDKDIIFISDNGSGGTQVYFELQGVSGGTNPFTVFPDSSNLVLGDGHDMRMYHNGSGSYVDNYTGVLQFTNYADDSDIIFKSDDGSGGTATYFRVDGGAVETRFLKSTRHFDNVGAYFGDSADLQIYHDGSNSYIQDTGTGDLKLLGTNLRLKNGADTITFLEALSGGAVSIYHNGSKRFETTSSGVTVTGDLTVTGGDISLGGTGRIQGIDTVSAGTDAANKDYVDTAVAGSGSGTVTSVSSATTSQLTVSQSSPAPALSIVTAAVTNGGTALATGDQIYDATTARLTNYLPLTGGTMIGVTQFNDHTQHGDQVEARWGAGNDFTIQHNGTDSFIDNDTGHLYIRNSGNDKDVYFQNDDGGGGLANYFYLDGGIAKTVFSRDAQFLDNAKALFGTGNDLQIYHDGSNSIIKDSGSGNLVINAGSFVVSNAADTQNILIGVDGAEVRLYHNGSKKLETTVNGIALPQGNNASPSISKDGDSNTGMYWGASDELNFSTAGINRLIIDSNGLTVNGNVSLDEDVVLGASSSIVLDDTPTASTASGSGTIVKWSVSVSTTAGTLYVIKTDGGWTTADADSEAKSTAMAAIALGSNATSGMLLQGFFYKASHGFSIGAPLYISNTAGAFSNTRPTGTGDYVRIIGYATSTNYIYFDPDKTWVKID